MQIYAHLDGATTDASRSVRELIELADNLVPGKDIFPAAFAANLVNITALSPQPQPGWTTGDNGKTFTAPVVVPVPLATVQAALCADIDTQAQAIRDLYVTPGGAQAATYLFKQNQAVQAQAAQGTTDQGKTAAQLASQYPDLANEIGITVDPSTSQPATDVYGVMRAVLATLAVWLPINRAIEAMRLKTKAAILAATTATAAQTAHDGVTWPASAAPAAST